MCFLSFSIRRLLTLIPPYPPFPSAFSFAKLQKPLYLSRPNHFNKYYNIPDRIWYLCYNRFCRTVLLVLCRCSLISFISTKCAHIVRPMTTCSLNNSTRWATQYSCKQAVERKTDEQSTRHSRIFAFRADFQSNITYTFCIIYFARLEIESSRFKYCSNPIYFLSIQCLDIIVSNRLHRSQNVRWQCNWESFIHCKQK